MIKILNPGTLDIYGQVAQVYIRVKWDGHRLSFSGVEGPVWGSHCLGSCGQICDDLDQIRPGPGWNKKKIARLKEVWLEWHLNDMQSACEHQQELGWTWLSHPSEPCPTCGYRLGSAWLTKEVPQWVIVYLDSLPASRTQPAWIPS